MRPTNTADQTSHRFFSARLSLWGLISAGALANLLASVLGFGAHIYPLLDIFNAFRVQYGVALLIMALLFLGGRRKQAFIICMVGAVFNVAIFMPVYLNPNTAGPDEITLSALETDNNRTKTLLLHNISIDNTHYAAVLNTIANEDPDYIALLEVTTAWAQQLAPIRARYPHHIEEIRDDNFGIGFYSKSAFLNAKTDTFKDANNPSRFIRVTLADEPITFLITHPVPPIGNDFVNYRNATLQKLAAVASTTNGAIVLAGDLNTPPWSPVFHKLVTSSKLRDSRQGFGIQPTWPSHFKILYTPIDHVLISDEILVHNRRIGPANGSDHHAIILQLSVRGY